MLKTALFVVSPYSEQPKCASTDEWINKSQYRHIMKYYSAIKKYKISTYSTAWNIKIIIMSEINQIKKEYDFIYIKSRKCQLIYSDRKISGYWGLKVGRRQRL